MIPPQLTLDESQRIESLRRYAVLDTLPEQALDDLTALAAHICEAPIALISLVDENRQWFKAKVGVDMSETARDISFCGHAIHRRDLFIVPDAMQDERFIKNPMVTGEPRIRFYAGAPLVSADDAALGAFCVMDHVPRVLTEAQKQALRVLARQVMTHLELRRDARQLAESESRFRLLAENITDVFWISSPDLEKMYYISPAYQRIWGRCPEDLYLNPHQWVEAILPEDRERVLHVFGALTKSQPSVSVEYRIARPDGSIRWVNDRGFQVRDASGTLVRLTGIVAEITERKQVEIASLRLAAIVESSDDAIIGKDLDSVITSWNKGAEKIFGYAADEMVGTSIMRLIPEDRWHEEDQILQQITLGKSLEHFETLRKTKDGRLIDVSVTASPIKDATGKAIGVSKVARDITERKSIEAQLMRAQRMESIGTLAGGIAHDLNNILSPIILSIGVLKSISDKPAALRMLEIIETSAKRGSDIVRQVLSFARGVEGQKIEVQPKHLLKDLENIIKDTFPKDIRLQFSVPTDVWTMLGDPTQVQQILLNLSVNARDAMPNGGCLAVAVENCLLDEQYATMHIEAKAGRYVKISVTDSGTGIARDILDKIFMPFFTTKELNKGTGLGLSTVMAIVKSHDGFINVYSEPGKGTTFKVYLPAMENSAKGREQESAKFSLPRGNGETVLIVDDEDSILTVTSQTLQAFGYRVLTATNGADAVGAYVQHKNEIAVVLTDMMMPIMDGAAVIHALKRINPQVKIIAASGLSTYGGMVDASGAGLKHFLTKPYTAETLLTALQGILEDGLTEWDSTLVMRNNGTPK